MEKGLDIITDVKIENTFDKKVQAALTKAVKINQLKTIATNEIVDVVKEKEKL